MKKIMIKKGIITGLCMAFVVIQVQAQTIDSERMKRDLAVTENVLSTLIGETSDSKIFVGHRNQQVSGDYIKDYGVIFTVNSGLIGDLATFPKAISLYSNRLRFSPGSGQSGYIIGRERYNPKGQKLDAVPEPHEDEDEDEEKSFEDLKKESKADFIERSKDFLADYAHLISQLKPEDQIMIRMTSGQAHGLSWAQAYIVDATPNDRIEIHPDSESSQEIMIEVKVSDIEAHRKGQISRDAFMKKVTVTEVEKSNEKLPDLEMISSMFHRLYQRDLSETYYTLSNISYSSVKGVGIVFTMRVYSSYESENFFYLPSTGDKGLNLEERNKKVQELLPKFEQSFKENMVNYGRSIKSLEANELLIFEVQLTQCKQCDDFPKAIKFSIKKSILDDFNNGKISESQAVGQVGVEREK